MKDLCLKLPFLQSLCPCMDEPVCVPADKEYSSVLETKCVFIEHNEENVAPLLDALDMLHSLSFQLFDAKLLCLSEAKAALVQEHLNHTVRHCLQFSTYEIILLMSY